MPELTVLIPASNEQALIGRCLEAIIGSDWPSHDWVEILVISNGSLDSTTEVARSYTEQAAQKSWVLHVLDRKQGGKLAALNVGDRVARGSNRVYLDADVVIEPDVLFKLHKTLSTGAARYASGTLTLAHPKTWVTRAYARIYAKVPFMRHGVPGAGLFAVNAAGRMRWDDFPDIISDDTFVRLSFSPEERIAVDARYSWPLVEGWRNLVRVRKRQDAGVEELRRDYPHLFDNDDKSEFSLWDKVKLAVGDPVGFAVYAGVALAVRFSRGDQTAWSRGR